MSTVTTTSPLTDGEKYRVEAENLYELAQEFEQAQREGKPFPSAPNYPWWDKKWSGYQAALQCISKALAWAEAADHIEAPFTPEFLSKLHKLHQDVLDAFVRDEWH